MILMSAASHSTANRSKVNVLHIPWDMFKVLPEVGVKAPCHGRLCQTFPADPYNTFGPARSDEHPTPLLEPTHYQVVVNG